LQQLIQIILLTSGNVEYYFLVILRGNKQWLNCGNYSTTALHKPTHYEEKLAKNLFRNFTPVFLHMLKYSWVYTHTHTQSCLFMYCSFANNGPLLILLLLCFLSGFQLLGRKKKEISGGRISNDISRSNKEEQKFLL
jgi:hypothetical protein